MPLIHSCQYVIGDFNQAAHREVGSAMFNLAFYSLVVIHLRLYGKKLSLSLLNIFLLPEPYILPKDKNIFRIH